MNKIFLIYYRNMSSITLEIFELKEDNNKAWWAYLDHTREVNYNPRRQELYNEFVCALVKRYGNQTIEDLPNLPLTRILDLAGENMRYPYNNGYYYICKADNVMDAVLKYYGQGGKQ